MPQEIARRFPSTSSKFRSGLLRKNIATSCPPLISEAVLPPVKQSFLMVLGKGIGEVRSDVDEAESKVLVVFAAAGAKGIVRQHTLKMIWIRWVQTARKLTHPASQSLSITSNDY